MIQDVSTHQGELESMCRRYGVRRLDLFGSAATGHFRSDNSDIDFLVEFESPSDPGYANRYFGLLEDLEKLFGRPVDLVVESAVRNSHFREAANRTRAGVYAS